MNNQTTSTAPPLRLPISREQATALAASAARLGSLIDCRVLVIESAVLVEVAGKRDSLVLPIAASLAGSVVSSIETVVAAADDPRLHPHEQAQLSVVSGQFCVIAPVVCDDNQRVAGVIFGVGSGVEDIARVEQARLAVAGSAETLGLRYQLAFARSHAVHVRAAAKALLYNLRNGALLLDAASRVVDANEAAQALLGFTLDKAVGQPIETATDESEVVNLLKKVEATNNSDIPVVRVCGQTAELQVEVHVSPVYDDSHRLVWRLVVFNDTTVERTADELKNQFVSTVSHELRTPLTSIKAFAATLLHNRQAEPEDKHEWLKIIDHECDRLTSLVNDLLVISRLDSGRSLSMSWSEVDLMKVLHDVANEQQGATARHRVTVEGPQSIILEADDAKLRQVFTNLVNNAIKYSPRGGDVFVTVTQTDDEARINVSDQGCGIRPEQLNLVFERFYQADGSATRRVGGSGLGLYLTRRLVEAHGGKVWAESELGRGSTLVVVLPKHSRAGAV